MAKRVSPKLQRLFESYSHKKEVLKKYDKPLKPSLLLLRNTLLFTYDKVLELPFLRIINTVINNRFNS